VYRVAVAVAVCLLFACAPAQAATYATGETEQTLAPVAPDVSTLPDKLVIDPGYYIVNGQPYDMTKEGVYRFDGQQRIVYKDSLETLMSSLAWIMRHGSTDNGLSPAKSVEVAKTRNLVRTCGYQSWTASYVLKSLGYTARPVALVNKDYNGSHILVEVQVNGKWELWDLDYNAKPTVDGQATTIVDWAQSPGDRGAKIIARDETHILKIPLTAFYASYLNAPSIGTETFWPWTFTDPTDRAKMKAYSTSFLYLAPGTFYPRFYPNQSVTH
jgi:hypothetical protein